MRFAQRMKQTDDALTLQGLFNGKLYKLGVEQQELFRMLDKKGPYLMSKELQGQLTLHALINMNSVMTFFIQKQFQARKKELVNLRLEALKEKNKPRYSRLLKQAKEELQALTEKVHHDSFLYVGIEAKVFNDTIQHA